MPYDSSLTKLQEMTNCERVLPVKDKKTGKVLGAIMVNTFRKKIIGEHLLKILREHNQYLREHPDQVMVGIADVAGSPMPDMITDLPSAPEVKEFEQFIKDGRVLKLILVSHFGLVVKAANIYTKFFKGETYLEQAPAEKALARAEELIRTTQE